MPQGKRFPISSLIQAAPYSDTILNPVQRKALIEELTLSTPDREGSHLPLLNLAMRAVTDPRGCDHPPPGVVMLATVGRPSRATNTGGAVWCPAQQFLLNLGSAMTMGKQPGVRLGGGPFQ